MAKNTRVCDIKFQTSGDDAKTMEYNPASGGQKSLTVGPRLVPIPAPGNTYTTNVSAAPTPLPALGGLIAVYNNAGTAGSITIGGPAITALAIGATDAAGNVGVACPPNAWTYLAMSNNLYVISSAATLITYIIEDPTFFAQESGTYKQTQDPRTWLPINS